MWLHLSPPMSAIYDAISDLMDSCVKELRKSNKIDTSQLTLEHGLFKSFDDIVRRQLDSVWHTVSPKTKQVRAVGCLAVNACERTPTPRRCCLPELEPFCQLAHALLCPPSPMPCVPKSPVSCRHSLVPCSTVTLNDTALLRLSVLQNVVCGCSWCKT